MLASRLRTSWAASSTLLPAARARRSWRLAAPLPLLSSSSNSAKRAAPRASRFLALRVSLLAMG